MNNYNVWNITENRWMKAKYGYVTSTEVIKFQDIEYPDKLTLEQAKDHLKKYLIYWNNYYTNNNLSMPNVDWDIREIPFICKEDCCLGI